MRKIVALLALSVSGCLAQLIDPIPFPYFPPDLKQFLALSDDQVTKINALNAQFSSFQGTKFVRQAQVQSEIAEWTAKENLDSQALGLRYAEIEAIRREVSDRQKTTVTQIQALLTADQKAKLAVLEQALRLYSTACNGVSQNLLSPPVPTIQGIFPGNVIPASRFGITSFPGAGGCLTIPSVLVRSGNFSEIIQP